MRHLEDAECMALIEWADLHPVIRGRLVHVPNGGRRNAREAARLKRMGVRSGYPDFLLDVALGKYHGLRLEMKAPKGNRSNVTPMQADWMRFLAKEGYFCVLAYGWDNARTSIERYLDFGISGA